MKKSVVLSLVALLLPALACAQTMSIHVDDGSALVREYNVVTSVQFDVVTLIDTDGHDVSAIEWVQTALEEVVPGVFNLARVTASCDIDLGSRYLLARLS